MLQPWQLLSLLLVWAVPSSAAASAAMASLKAGDAAFAAGQLSQAASHYSDAIAADARQPLLYTKRAAAYLSQKRLSLAAKDLDQAVELDANFTSGYLHRGKLAKQLCDVAAARADFEAVLRLKASHTAATKELDGLGQLQEAVDQLEGMRERAEAGAVDAAAAQSLLDRVYASAPDCVPAQLLEARLEMARGNWEQAVAVTGRLVKSQPGHLEALTLRGQAYMYLGDHDLAKRHFGEALKFDPDHQASRAAFNRLKDLDRKRQRAAKALAAGELAQAEAGLVAALAVDPAHRAVNKGLHLELCRLQQQLGEAKAAAAVQSCEAALALDTRYLEAEKELVRAKLAAQQYEQAVSRARAMLGAHQQDRECHQLLRDAERQLKMSQRKDYYKILGVARDAKTRTIKRAYKLLAVQHHPDKHQAAEDKQANEDKFREIAEAMEVLSDEQKRAAYDRGDDVETSGWHGQQQHPFFHQQATWSFQWG